MSEAYQRGHTMMAQTQGDNEITSETGLLSGHSYPVVGFFESVSDETEDEQVCLVKLHNPWGSSVDNFGEWSNDSARWTPGLREQLGCFSNDDTFFFMTFDDYYSKHKRTTFVLTQPEMPFAIADQPQ